MPLNSTGYRNVAPCRRTTGALEPVLAAAMRAGTQLKIALQDANKRQIAIDVPLLGFGLALDRAK